MASLSDKTLAGPDAALSARQIFILCLCMLTLLLDGLDIQILAFAAPSILSEWRISSADFGPALSASLFGMAAGTLAGGALGDRYGRRTVVNMSVLVFGACTFLTAWVSDLPTLATLRLICGLGFGAAIPNAMTLASECVPARHHSVAIALTAVGTPLGGVVGSAVSGFLIVELGWRACFQISGAFTLGCAVLLILGLPESRAYLERERPFGAAAARPRDVPAADGDRAGTERRDGLFSLSYRRTTVSLAVGFFGNSFATFVMLSWLPVVLTIAGMTIKEALAGSFSFNLAAMAGALGAGWCVKSAGSRVAALAMVVGVIGSLAALALTLTKVVVVSVAAVLALIGLAGLTMGGLQTILYSVAVPAYEARLRTTEVGFAATAGRGGGIVAVLVAGVLLSLEAYKLQSFFGLIALNICGAGLALAFLDRHLAAVAVARSSRPRTTPPAIVHPAHTSASKPTGEINE